MRGRAQRAEVKGTASSERWPCAGTDRILQHISAYCLRADRTAAHHGVRSVRLPLAFVASATLSESTQSAMTNHLNDFDTPTNRAFVSLGALPPNRHWSRFDVPRNEALKGKASVLVTTIWNYHWFLDGSTRTATRPAISRDSNDGTLWYNIDRPGAGAPPTSVSHWNRITLARESAIPIVGVLKDFSTSRCSLLDTFRCSEVRDDIDRDAVWLKLEPRRPLTIDLEPVDIRKRTRKTSEPDQQTNEAIRAIDALIRPTAVAVGQSWVADAPRRRAIELHAMSQATDHYSRTWPVVEDVSAKESFDLRCRNGERELRVEVKGTTTEGGSVLLTRSEVRHAEDPTTEVALFVVSRILVDAANNCSGGVSTVIEPWIVDREKLSPIAYEYDLR